MSTGQIFALSVRQPWAWLIVNGHKRVENRTWSTRVRGHVLIHASKAFDNEGSRWLASESGIRLPINMPGANDLERGGIVGIAEITDCVTALDDPYFFGPYGFVLKNARTLALIPCKGALGMFAPSADVVANALQRGAA